MCYLVWIPCQSTDFNTSLYWRSERVSDSPLCFFHSFASSLFLRYPVIVRQPIAELFAVSQCWLWEGVPSHREGTSKCGKSSATPFEAGYVSNVNECPLERCALHQWAVWSNRGIKDSYTHNPTDICYTDNLKIQPRFIFYYSIRHMIPVEIRMTINIVVCKFFVLTTHFPIMLWLLCWMPRRHNCNIFIFFSTKCQITFIILVFYFCIIIKAYFITYK